MAEAKIVADVELAKRVIAGYLVQEYGGITMERALSSLSLDSRYPSTTPRFQTTLPAHQGLLFTAQTTDDKTFYVVHTK